MKRSVVYRNSASLFWDSCDDHISNSVQACTAFNVGEVENIVTTMLQKVKCFLALIKTISFVEIYLFQSKVTLNAKIFNFIIVHILFDILFMCFIYIFFRINGSFFLIMSVGLCSQGAVYSLTILILKLCSPLC
jgi:hypothetical protein